MTLAGLLLTADLTPLKAVRGMQQCPVCRGRGTVDAVLVLTDELGAVHEAVRCPACQGEGFTGKAPQWARHLARDIAAAVRHC